MPRATIPELEREAVEDELRRHVQKLCNIDESAARASIEEVLEAMPRARKAVALIKAESTALNRLVKPLEAWARTHDAVAVVRDATTHEAWDHQRTNAALADAVHKLVAAELARRGELPRAEALDSGATRQKRGDGPAVEWFVGYGAQRGLDAKALMLLEGVAIARGMKPLRRGHTYWTNPTLAATAWRVLYKKVIPDAAGIEG